MDTLESLETTVTETDHWIAANTGKRFARTWVPSNAGSASAHILLLHDSLGCVDLWRDFPRQLAIAARRSVVAYDRLGFGKSGARSGPLPETFIVDEALEVVPQLCDSLGLKTVIPFGHSVGGAMAIATAAHWPGRCAAVVTESAQTIIEDITLAGIRAARINFQQPEQFERLARYHGEKARWVLENWVDTWLSPAFSAWSLDGELRAVQCPALALHGDLDEYGSRQNPERIERLTKGPAEAVILEACGHVPHREQPARVLAEVTQFLERYTSPQEPANQYVDNPPNSD